MSLSPRLFTRVIAAWKAWRTWRDSVAKAARSAIRMPCLCWMVPSIAMRRPFWSVGYYQLVLNSEDHRRLVRLDEHFEPCFSSFSTWNCEISASGEAFSSLPAVSIVKIIQEWYLVVGGRWCSISVLFGYVGRMLGGQAYQEGLSQYTKLEN